jgi:adenosylmethionine-8-amino-7-oxononanoate aminotransferase
MGAVEIVKNKATKEPFPREARVGARLCEKMRPKGAVLRPLGDCVVVMPPVAIDTRLLTELLEIVRETIKQDLGAIADGTS